MADEYDGSSSSSDDDEPQFFESRADYIKFLYKDDHEYRESILIRNRNYQPNEEKRLKKNERERERYRTNNVYRERCLQRKRDTSKEKYARRKLAKLAARATSTVEP